MAISIKFRTTINQDKPEVKLVLSGNVIMYIERATRP